MRRSSTSEPTNLAGGEKKTKENEKYKKKSQKREDKKRKKHHHGEHAVALSNPSNWLEELYAIRHRFLYFEPRRMFPMLNITYITVLKISFI